LSRAAAGWFGASLLVLGVAAAFFCGVGSGLLALATAVSVLVYDSWGKHHGLIGPFNMGLCRGLNLLLGMSLGMGSHLDRLPIMLITLCYIAGVTTISRGEVRGGNRVAATVSGVWLAVCVLVLSVLCACHKQGLLYAGPVLAIWAIRVAPPFARAFRTLKPQDVRMAVRAGVLSLVILDAGLAALYGGPWYGLAVLALYVPAMLLAKLVAVT
jgi:4-hydroxybenzoate polyprenyltransferase